MKRLPFSLLTATLLGAVTAQAQPLLQLGDNAALFFNGSTSIQYVSNVFLDDDVEFVWNDANDNGVVDIGEAGFLPVEEQDNTLFILSPGLELRFGRPNGDNVATIYFREDFKFYFEDDDELDNQLANLFFNARSNMGRFTFKVDFAWYQTDSSTSDINRVGALIERDILNLKTYGELEISNKTSVGAGVFYNSVTYNSFEYNPISGLGFVDRSSWGIPVDFYYSMTPKVDLSLGYRYRDTDVDEFSDYTDHYFNVGLRGELLPKLDLLFKIGWLTREFDQGNIDDDDTLATSLTATYDISPRFRLTFDVERDFSASGLGTATEETSFGISGLYQITDFIQGNAGIRYRDTSYESGRDDETFNFNIGMSYVPNEYVRLSAGYVYQSNDSNQVGSGFENNIVRFTASLRY